MKRMIIISDEQIDELNALLDNIDTEIGSTITFKDDPEIVIKNMTSTNSYLGKIKALLYNEDEMQRVTQGTSDTKPTFPNAEYIIPLTASKEIMDEVDRR